MPTSSSRRPLPKTYRIERQLIDEHNQRMKRAHDTWSGYPVCPDCYKPPHLCGHMNLKLKP
jgi:hypothetical protein